MARLKDYPAQGLDVFLHPLAFGNGSEKGYFLDCNDPGESCAIYTGNHITPLINAPAYFAALYQDIARLGQSGRNPLGEFLYIAGFVLNFLYPGDPLTLPGPNGPVRLIDLLIEKARAGVDVRVLAWIPWNLSLANRVDLRPESADNMRTIQALRQEPALAAKACLNIIAHPAGSTHVKMLVMGGEDWSVGYSGGIDLSPDRYDPNWQDVQARVEGPAVQPIYDIFREMWNQNIEFSGAGRPKTAVQQPGRLLRAPRPVMVNGRIGKMAAVPPETSAVETRKLVNAGRGSHTVQSLMTVPSFKFAFSPLLFRWRVSPLDMAPRGLFTVRDAIKKAIANARHYIYVEDQYFWSVEVMQWLRESVLSHVNLRVILVTGTSDQLGPRLDYYRQYAVEEGLLAGLDDRQRARVCFIHRPDMVHSKTMLVDDIWGLIGSVNIARRSLYMDIEHAMAFEDTHNQLVRDYRVTLWKNRLGSRAAGVDLTNLDRAIPIWELEPDRKSSRTSFTPIDFEWYNMVDDPDSRRPWYFPLRFSYGRFMPPENPD